MGAETDIDLLGEAIAFCSALNSEHRSVGCEYHFENFPDRFEAAYRLELEAFIRALQDGRKPAPVPERGIGNPSAGVDSDQEPARRPSREG